VPPKPKDEEAELTALLATVNREHGTGTIMRLGDSPLEAPATFSSGSIRLDEALGIGGLPRGRVIEAYGPESSGKTTLVLHAIAEAQKAGFRAAFVDAEHALDPEWATTIGVQVDDLYVSQPDTGEQALQVVSKLSGSGLFAIIGVDSVAALVPKAEIEGNIGDSHVGLQARMMSQSLRMLCGPAQKAGTTIFFINQLREKVGVMFGSPETTAGGKALKFYASIRLDIRRIETLKDGTESVGNRVRIKVVKNKLAPPFRQAEVDLMFGEGISRAGELIDLGVERGVIAKAGAWYTHQGKQLGQGKEKARQALREDKGLAGEIEAAVRAARPVTVKPAAAARGRAGVDASLPWEEAQAGSQES
jgi:recombination protein RecA